MKWQRGWKEVMDRMGSTEVEISLGSQFDKKNKEIESGWGVWAEWQWRGLEIEAEASVSWRKHSRLSCSG